MRHEPAELAVVVRDAAAVVALVTERSIVTAAATIVPPTIA
jgi:hypothetical protein